MSIFRRLVVTLLLGLVCLIGQRAYAAEKPPEPFAGEPFPVAIYGMPNTGAAFKIAKGWGATHVHRYGMGMSIEKDQAFFDLAQKYDLKVMASVRAKYWIKDDKDLDDLRAYVRHFKDHAALGFWYLCDEPDNHGIPVKKLAPLYKILKEETPGVPVAIAHAWSKHWDRYGDVEDVLMYDNYPIDGEPFPNVSLNSWTNFTKSVMNRGRKDDDAVMPVLQMFNWRAMAKEGQETVRGHPIDKLRYPNTAELRYMSFNSVAQGACGLSFYSYYRSRRVDRQWTGRVLAPIIDEAKAFAKVTAGAEVTRVHRAEDQDLFVTVWKGDQETFMILINAWPTARSVRRSLGDAIESGTLEPWGQTRETNAELKGSKVVVDQVKPWEVFIWRVENPS